MVTRQRLLLIDDSQAIHKLVVAMLGDMAVDVFSAYDGADGLKMADRCAPDLILLDLKLPDIDGFMVCERLKGNLRTADVPVIFLTGSEGTEDKIRAFDLGATDYVVKPFNRGELRARVGAALRNRTLVELLQQLAQSDRLTGLANRELFHEHLRSVVSSKGRDGQVGVMFLDLNRFKLINDTLGHAAGDQLLVEVARRIRSVLQQSTAATDAFAARLGGDEFAILMPTESSPIQLAMVAEALHESLAAPYALLGHDVCTSAAIGIAASGSRRDAEELLRDADTAMYHAKSRGDRYVVFDQAMHERLSAQLRLEGELRKAIARQDFVLYYQPMVCLESGGLLGFEALLRWRHPELGMISPDRFIPLAEETGLIMPLGQWVFTEACRQVGDWQRRHGVELAMNINLSRKQFMQPDLIEMIASAVHRAGIDPACIHAEVTENAIMQDLRMASGVLHRIRGVGVKLDMDDFGTGYSSLSCLHQFPLDGLKIDRSFIANMAIRRDYSAIVQAIVTLAFNLGIHVTAEGVETAEQMVQLQTLGCTRAQGYYFGKPMPALAAESVIMGQTPLAQTA